MPPHAAIRPAVRDPLTPVSKPRVDLRAAPQRVAPVKGAPFPAIDSDAASQLSAINEFRLSWRILCAALLGMLCCCIPGASIGMFIGPWSNTYGWSLSTIGSFTIFLGLGAAISGPIIGRLMDRFGARRVALTYIPLLALAVFALSLIGSIWALYFGMLVWGCIAPGLGAYARTIGSWFDAGRGKALGIICVGVGLSTAIAPQLARWLVDDYGWRTGQRLLAACVLLAWPVAFFWLHQRRNVANSKSPWVEIGYTRQEALKSAVFWLLGSSFFLWGLTAGGSVFLIPFLSTHGMGRAEAASCVSLLGLTIVVFLPIIGAIIDRVHAPFVAAGAVFLAALAFVALGLFGVTHALLAVPVIGIAASAWMSCLDYSCARYFGLKSFGEISALIDRWACIGIMIGPTIFSFLKDATGGYMVPYIAVGALAGGSALCMAIAGRRPFAFQRIPRNS